MGIKPPVFVNETKSYAIYKKDLKLWSRIKNQVLERWKDDEDDAIWEALTEVRVGYWSP